MTSNSVVDLDKDKALTRALKALPDAAKPSQDLWPGIASRLIPRETKTYTPGWIPWAIAATLMVCISAILISWNNLHTAQLIVADGQLQVETGLSDDILSQLESMEQEYGLARSALLTQIGAGSREGGVDLLADVKGNLFIIEQAISDLKAAIVKQPENPGLPKLLKATYQQELAVLSQLAKLNQVI